ncbi:MFS transporter [Roseovarius sp. SCSIO 43702]|uniref:MFS transporter n=1 Tax=Roseovarius sp. SCSIO 43702 TaxID=2823043 RepID=UPI001C73A56B|nr:MFS transporter [Roseovarius sp. SCSIO 43702]QYX56956.1 MFS transporter [Roseovarius sp. SCSIO 43702]
MDEAASRKRIWGWYFFDWASQPYHTLLVTFVFGPFFASIATAHYAGMGLNETLADAKAQSLWSGCLTITGLIIGFGAPLLGAMADTVGKRLPWIVFFSALYVIGASGIWWTNPDGSNLTWALVTFGVGFIGAEYALIFINSQLPSLGTREDVGKISGSGFAFGYAGGLLSLLIMLVFFLEQPTGKTLVGLDPAFGLDPAQREGARFVGPFTALWFAVFMIPYFLWVPDLGPGRRGRGFGDALRLLKRSIMNLGARRSLLTYLGSSMLYRDALNGLYGFGGTYALLVLNWDIVRVGVFGIVGALSAAAFSWIGGRFDGRFGPKPVIIGAILGLTIVCVIIVSMDRSQLLWMPLEDGSGLPDVTFLICGALIGGLGGTLQAASRSLMVRHTDPDAPTESFGLYGLSGRATAFLAPALVWAATEMSGNARIGITPVIGLFLIGLLLLRWVRAEGDQPT